MWSARVTQQCPTCKEIHPRSYKSCPHLWSQPLLLSVPVVLPDLQEEVEQKLCFLHLPTQKIPGMLNQTVVVAKPSSTTPNPSNHRAIKVGINRAAFNECSAIWRFQLKLED